MGEFIKQKEKSGMLEGQVQKAQSDRENLQSEMEILLDRINKLSELLDKARRDKDDAVGELDALKARLELTQSAHTRIVEEKEMTNKELERLLEKYDRAQG